MIGQYSLVEALRSLRKDYPLRMFLLASTSLQATPAQLRDGR